MKNYNLIVLLASLLLNFNIYAQNNRILSGEVHFNKGKEYAENDDYINALLEFSIAIEINPYNWQYYQNRCSLEMKNKNFESALKDINKSLELKPKSENPGSLSTRGRIYDETFEYFKSIEDWTYMINYFQDFMNVKIGDVHLRRGKAYLYTNQKELACKDFHESLNGNFRLQDGKEFIKKYCD